MKKIFRMALVCALAGATLLYTGCTKDYSEDISNLESRLDNLEVVKIKPLEEQVASLEKAKADLEAFKEQAEKSIEKLQRSVSTLESKMPDLETDVEANKTAIDGIKEQITAINGDIDKLKASVQTIDGKIADINKTVADLQTKKADKSYVDETFATIQTVSKLAAEVKGQISVLSKDITDLKSELAKTNGNVTKLQEELSSVKSDLAKVKAVADSALEKANKALSETEAIREALEAIYTKTEVDAIVNGLSDRINNKLDIEAYQRDTAVINAKVRAIETSLNGVIEAYQKADLAINTRIDNLSQNVYNLLDTKLDKQTFAQFKEELDRQLNALSADVATLLARVQSLVNVPQYSDHKLRFNYATIQTNEINATLPEGPSDAAQVAPCVMGSTVVKYRVYGEDAAELALALVQAKDSLAFDVVSVVPVKSDAEPTVEIIDVAVSEDDAAVLDIKVLPRNFGTEFFKNEKSYSMSLVLTDTEKSNLIQSCYNNVVPGTPKEMLVEIRKGGKDGKNVTNTVADTIKVQFTDLEPKAILETEGLFFIVDNQANTYEELIEKNWDMPEVDTVITHVPNFTEAIDADSAPEDYFTLDTEAATVALKEVVSDMVGAADTATVTYNIGGMASVFASQLEKVIPIQINIKGHIRESEAVDAFTWAYDLDAESDQYYYQVDEPARSVRDSAVVVFPESEMAKLAEFEIEWPASFDHKVPVADSIVLVSQDGTEAKDTVNTKYPYFVENQLMMKIGKFLWDSKYIIRAQYNFPSDEKTAIEVHVEADFTTVDRNREPIVITLPTETVKYCIDYDSTFVNVLNDATVAPEIYLSNNEITKAFNVELPVHTDSLKVSLDGVPENVAQGNNAITTTVAGDETVLQFSSHATVLDDELANKEIGDTLELTCNSDLWYGQKVIVTKKVVFDVTGLYDFERINEYVKYMSDIDCFTTIQPLWKPNEASLDMTLPLEAYDASAVDLNQHFRVRDVAADSVCTKPNGDLKNDYLVRKFYLEKPDGTIIDSGNVIDPRNAKSDFIAKATGISIDANNSLTYKSMDESIDVYGTLSITNSNQSIKPLKTRFDLKPSYNPAETYAKYVVKKYDPLKELTVVANDAAVEGKGTQAEPFKVNINNSVKRPVSIYQFLSLKDKRGHETIDPANDGWVVGDGNNGFATDITVVNLYGLQYTHKMEYVTNVSEETKARINFDATTGLLSFDNVLQTQLAEPIVLTLTVQIDYIWGQRGYDTPIYVQFYNKPVGE